ncbi:O-antigen ligase family protein [bacterium]|nr:O-antigen ligase family protein [bacterium]
MKGLLFTYLLCYGGSIVSLIRPWYGLLIYVCFAIIRPEAMWPWSLSGGGQFSRIIAIALLIGWGINGFGKWNLGNAKLPTVSLLLFWIWAAISTALSAQNLNVGINFLEAQGKILLPFLVGISLINSEKHVKQLAWVILLSQGYVAYSMNDSYFSGFNPLDSNVGTGSFGGMDNNCVAIAMVTGCGLAFFFGMHQKIWWRKWLAFILAGLMAHTIMFAFSRGGQLALVVTGATSFYLIDKQPKHFAFFLLAVALGLRMAGPEVRERFYTTFADQTERDASAQSRVDMWKNCIDVMVTHPLLGVGPDHWPLIAHLYGWGRGKEAHTMWLQTGAELGVPGLLFLLSFYMSTMWMLYPVARRKIAYANEWDVSVARMMIASFVGFMFSAQFVSLEGLELPYYICLIGAGTLKLLSSKKLAFQNQQLIAQLQNRNQALANANPH